MPDSVTFGCPAPRLGLDLASLRSAPALASSFAQLGSSCRKKLDLEIQFSELLNPLIGMSRTP